MEKLRFNKGIIFMLAFYALLLATCGGGGDQRDVIFTWNSNKEVSVNTSGGGYILYYSQTPSFDTASAGSVDIPYASGSTAPTTTTLRLNDGVWYVSVVAYGSVAGATKYSQASSEYTVDVKEN